MAKNIITKVINTVSFVIIIIAIMLLLSVVMTRSGDIPDVGGYSFLQVVTGSMEPEIKTDSIIIIKDVEPSEIKKDDIISFYFYEDGMTGAVNTHRVTDVEFDGEHYLFHTKGDANAVEDKYITPDTDYLGKVIFKSYPLGVAIRLAANPIIFFPLILLPLLIMIIVNLVDTIKSTKEIAKQEEQAEIEKLLAELEKRKKESDL